MTRRWLMVLVVAVVLAAAACPAGADVAEPGRKCQAVPFTAVQVQDEFWSPRVKTNLEQSLPHNIAYCRKTGRIDNFAKAAGLMQGKHVGICFDDSDVYKVLEGASYALVGNRGGELEKQVDDVIATIAAAQQKDGYLFTYYILGDARRRWKDIHEPPVFELYCAGHLIEAGVAHFQATGKRTLLDVAVKLADHIDTVFGPGRKMDVPDHEEIELALLRLYRATGERRYLALGQFFLDQRGNAAGHKLYGPEYQDHLPVRRQGEVVGHAVRAMYLGTGMADLAALTGEADLASACRRLWESAALRKMYVTGGVGAASAGEAFGADYDLPNRSAYAETCAAIGLVFFSHRMLQLDGDARYADVMERAMYNGVLSGVSLDGKRFFYVNPLASVGNHHRQDWYGCACCPTNIVRFLPAVGGYVYTHDDTSIYVNLYVGSRGTVPLSGGSVRITQQTRYPWEGTVRLALEPQRAGEFALCLRIPSWCPRAVIRVNGQGVETPPAVRGYARLSRAWKAGDVVELDLAMPVARVRANPRVRDDAARVALQRGPIVYCVEAADHGGRVAQLALPGDSPLTAEHRPDLLGGVTVIRGRAQARLLEPAAGEWLYRAAGPAEQVEPAERVQAVDLLAIPYYAWDHRAAGEMAVWLPESSALAEPVTPPTPTRPAK